MENLTRRPFYVKEVVIHIRANLSRCTVLHVQGGLQGCAVLHKFPGCRMNAANSLEWRSQQAAPTGYQQVHHLPGLTSI